jgi:hypothetical protein
MTELEVLQNIYGGLISMSEQATRREFYLSAIAFALWMQLGMMAMRRYLGSFRGRDTGGGMGGSS